MENISGILLFNVQKLFPLELTGSQCAPPYASTGRTNKTVREGIFEKVVTVA